MVWDIVRQLRLAEIVDQMVVDRLICFSPDLVVVSVNKQNNVFFCVYTTNKNYLPHIIN